MQFINKYLAVGEILKPYRQNGLLLARIETAFLDDISKANAVFLKVDGLHVPFFIETFEPDDESCLIKLEEFNSPEVIKSWNGQEIFLNIRDVSSDSLQKQKKTSLDHINGFTLVDNSTKRTFVITDVEEYPQQLMATVESDGISVLVPLIEQWISEIDEEQKLIFMDLPDGLI